MSSERNVEFKTYDGLLLRGTFYSAGEQRPCIIMSSGFSGGRNHFLPDFARRLQAAGFGALVYDNRNFGDSEGSPRHEVDPDFQVRDYSDAFNYATRLADVDASKVVYWGSSFSGGNVLKAAALNKSIAAVIAQVPYVSGDWVSRTSGQSAAPLLMERGNAAATGERAMIPVWPQENQSPGEKGKSVLDDPSAVPFVAEMTRRGYAWAETVTAQSMVNCLLHEPMAYVHRISPTPLLMVVATKDTVTDTRSQLETFERALQPKTLQVLPNEDHFSVYMGEGFEKNVAWQIDFLQKTLGA